MLYILLAYLLIYAIAENFVRKVFDNFPFEAILIYWRFLKC